MQTLPEHEGCIDHRGGVRVPSDTSENPGLTLEQRERVCREVLDAAPSIVPDRWKIAGSYFDTPHFTNWHDFGLIVDAMREKGYGMQITANASGLVCVEFGLHAYTSEPYKGYHGDHLNPTVAVALAALRAVLQQSIRQTVEDSKEILDGLE